ncbi:hypothetical protein [uncultured Gordonia sp.]|uniref:hypothetical protein n=1 Tax=uncultured Gordonia sp. TaxID=198437 RepID=UPI002582F95E|nr:hypothetical protein [uncultured Gordonia sp.]
MPNVTFTLADNGQGPMSLRFAPRELHVSGSEIVTPVPKPGWQTFARGVLHTVDLDEGPWQVHGLKGRASGSIDEFDVGPAGGDLHTMIAIGVPASTPMTKLTAAAQAAAQAAVDSLDVLTSEALTTPGSPAKAALDASYAPSSDIAKTALAEPVQDALDRAEQSVQISEGPLDVRRFDVKQDGVTDDTAAFQAAINALPANGGALRLPPSTQTMELSAPINVPKDGVYIVGSGRASRIAYRGNGDAFDLSSRRDCVFDGFRITHYGSSGAVFDLDNSFRNSFSRLDLDGMHYNNPAAPNTPATGQRGFNLRGNAGDNRIIDTDLNNFGVGVETSAIMNFFLGGVIGTCHTGVLGSGADSGMEIHGASFTSAPGRVAYNVRTPVSGNVWWVSDVWMEGADVPVSVGAAGVGGPVAFILRSAKLAGTSKCLDIQAAGYSQLEGVRFSVNPSATPTPLTIGAGAPAGFASGLVNDQGGDLAASLFPAGWTYLPRFNSEPALLSSRTVRAGVGLAAGQASYYESGGGRFRAGYDGTNVVVSDAAGGREVQLVSGPSAMRGVRVSSAGVGFNGVAPVARQTVGAAATDPTSTMERLNEIRAALVANGLLS